MKEILFMIILVVGFMFNKAYSSIVANVMLGYATYDDTYFKDVNNSLIYQNMLEFPLKLVDNYPSKPYYLFEVDFVNKKRTFSLGINFLKMSTGSRLDCSYKNIENYIDNVVDFYQCGIIFKFPLFKPYNKQDFSFNPELSFSAGCTYISLNSTDNLISNNQTIAIGKCLMIDRNQYFEPDLTLSMSYNHIILCPQFGYCLLLKGSALGDWNGIRAGVKLGYEFEL